MKEIFHMSISRGIPSYPVPQFGKTSLRQKLALAVPALAMLATTACGGVSLNKPNTGNPQLPTGNTHQYWQGSYPDILSCDPATKQARLTTDDPTGKMRTQWSLKPGPQGYSMDSSQYWVTNDRGTIITRDGDQYRCAEGGRHYSKDGTPLDQ
jgi:hypothetical protein